jgi:hypothetical protein
MPLAAVGLFVMVLGILATLNLGQAVHQKIKLQNTADAAAYTLAAMEARTFNYIAFLNRAQIAHYNTAMVIQSYLSWVGFQIALFGTASDMVITLKNAVIVGTRFPWPANKPYLAIQSIATMMAQLAEMFRKFAVQIYESEVGEKLGHKIVEAMALFNRDAVWQTQFARAALLNVHILTGMQNYIEKNDPDISFTSGKSVLLNLLVNGAMNSIEYYQTFDNASGLNPYVYGIGRDLKRVFPAWKGKYHDKDDAGRKEAFRIMAELCHATRTPQFVSNRADTAYGVAIVATVFGNKLGQTKFTTENELSKAQVPSIASDGNYPDSRNLSSDDFLQSGQGFATLGLANVSYTSSSRAVGDAISAYDQKTKHYRYTGPDSTSENRISPEGGNRVIAFPYPTGSATSAEEQTHSDVAWPGFAPYFLFKPRGDRTADYNQPSTWIFLNKHHKDFQTESPSHSDGRAPWYGKFTWQNGPQQVSLDTTIGGSRNSYLFEGLNVIARGMAYYHRPGNWREHPNFFNPYWRARLAPVGQKLQAFWDRYVTKNISTSSESAVVQTAVQVLKNAQMDLMTAMITSIITH